MNIPFSGNFKKFQISIPVSGKFRERRLRLFLQTQGAETDTPQAIRLIFTKATKLVATSSTAPAHYVPSESDSLSTCLPLPRILLDKRPRRPGPPSVLSTPSEAEAGTYAALAEAPAAAASVPVASDPSAGRLVSPGAMTSENKCSEKQANQSTHRQRKEDEEEKRTQNEKRGTGSVSSIGWWGWVFGMHHFPGSNVFSSL